MNKGYKLRDTWTGEIKEYKTRIEISKIINSSKSGGKYSIKNGKLHKNRWKITRVN